MQNLIWQKFKGKTNSKLKWTGCNAVAELLNPKLQQNLSQAVFLQVLRTKKRKKKRTIYAMKFIQSSAKVISLYCNLYFYQDKDSAWYISFQKLTQQKQQKNHIQSLPTACEKVSRGFTTRQVLTVGIFLGCSRKTCKNMMQNIHMKSKFLFIKNNRQNTNTCFFISK